MNVVPFIDIVLVLLVIVLATATFVTHKGVKLDLPNAQSSGKIPPLSVTLSVDKEGNYYYDGNPMGFDEIAQRIDTLDAHKDSVTLLMDKSAKFDYFIRLIDILKRKKFENLSIAAKQE